MDSMNSYRQTLKEILTEYARIPYSYGDVRNIPVFDDEGGHYMLVMIGWEGEKRHKRVHGCLVHVDIIDDKIWIQRDGTEDGVAVELVRAGVPRERIVLGFHPADVRPYTEFAVA